MQWKAVIEDGLETGMDMGWSSYVQYRKGLDGLEFGRGAQCWEDGGQV